MSCLFLTETLEKRRRGQRDEPGTSPPSTSDDSGLEMVGQAAPEYSSDTDVNSDSNSLQIMESDIDSSSDLERIGSDVELLVHDRKQPGHRGCPKPLITMATTRHSLSGCPVLSCSVCTGGFAAHNATGRLSKSVAMKVKGVLLLLLDRRVLISTSLYGALSFIAIIATVVCTCD